MYSGGAQVVLGYAVTYPTVDDDHLVRLLTVPGSGVLLHLG